MNYLCKALKQLLNLGHFLAGVMERKDTRAPWPHFIVHMLLGPGYVCQEIHKPSPGTDSLLSSFQAQTPRGVGGASTSSKRTLNKGSHRANIL